MVRIVVTDPPYGATKLSWDRFNDSVSVLKQLEKKVDAMIVFTNHRLLRDLLSNLSMKFHDIVIWDKSPRRGWISWRKPLHHIELITFWGDSKYFDFRKSKTPHPPYQRRFSRLKGGKKRVNKFSYPMYNQIWKIADVPRSKKIHPTQKPVKLLNRIMEIISHNSDLLIVDPFEGSGSTRKACENFGIKYIGNDTGEWKNENPLLMHFLT